MRRRPHVPEILLLPLLTLTLRMGLFFYYMESVQFNSVAQFCPTLCNPMDCSTPDFLVHHQLPELTQTHVHWVGDAIQPSHPLSSLLLLPSVFPSIRVFSKGSALRIRWPKDGLTWNTEHSSALGLRTAKDTPYHAFCLGLCCLFAWKLRGERRGST